MIVLILSEPSTASTEGGFHWFVLHDGVTLATWALAIFALVPLYALVDVINSRKRDNQLRLVQWLDNQFNSAAMISARRETAKMMLKDDFMRNMKQFVPTPAWPIVTFFDRVAVLWGDGKLQLEDIDIAYREYVFRVWSDFGKHLSGELLQGQYKQIEKLRDALQSIDEPRRPDDVAAAIAHVKTEFWRRESEL